MWTVLFIIAATTAVFPASSAPAGDVSHEDIRDAILSLVTIFRDNSDKLERHEYRERQLGEQLKKALAGLDKRYRSQDQIIAQISERLKSIETKIIENDEKQQQKVDKLSLVVDQILVSSGSEFGGKTGYAVQSVGSDPGITATLDRVSAALKENDETKKETEKIVKNIEHKLNKEFAHHTELLGSIRHHTGQIEHVVKSLPDRSEMQELLNGTAEKIDVVHENLIGNADGGVAKIIMRFDDKIAALVTGQEDLMKTTAEIQSVSEGFNEGVSQSYEQLLKEVKGLAKVEQVMIQTADNVMDTKRRIEYGVHQILLEVGELVKQNGKALNGTVNKKFDDIQTAILANQKGALSNLTTRIETEISQVWRQIGIMYQQLTASATALDRLQQQTDAYVNGSVKTMDSMENKVGLITSRMTEVDENLNFLLGKLSMVTSEYNQIKSGLAGALDDIRNSFLEVQSKLKDVGPGPRPIIEDKEIGNEVPSG